MSKKRIHFETINRQISVSNMPHPRISVVHIPIRTTTKTNTEVILDNHFTNNHRNVCRLNTFFEATGPAHHQNLSEYIHNSLMMRICAANSHADVSAKRAYAKLYIRQLSTHIMRVHGRRWWSPKVRLMGSFSSRVARILVAGAVATTPKHRCPIIQIGQSAYSMQSMCV